MMPPDRLVRHAPSANPHPLPQQPLQQPSLHHCNASPDHYHRNLLRHHNQQQQQQQQPPPPLPPRHPFAGGYSNELHAGPLLGVHRSVTAARSAPLGVPLTAHSDFHRTPPQMHFQQQLSNGIDAEYLNAILSSRTYSSPSQSRRGVADSRPPAVNLMREGNELYSQLDQWSQVDAPVHFNGSHSRRGTRTPVGEPSQFVGCAYGCAPQQTLYATAVWPAGASAAPLVVRSALYPIEPERLSGLCARYNLPPCCARALYSAVHRASTAPSQVPIAPYETHSLVTNDPAAAVWQQHQPQFASAPSQTCAQEFLFDASAVGRQPNAESNAHHQQHNHQEIVRALLLHFLLRTPTLSVTI